VRLVVQRVSRAQVRVDAEVVGGIGAGLVVLAAVGRRTLPDDVDWLARKLEGLRIFADAAGRMNRSVKECAGSVLLISQFTLYGDTDKGRRPSFVAAAEPETGARLCERLARQLEGRGVPVSCGVFGAHMEVELVNDGPVTLILERASGA